MASEYSGERRRTVRRNLRREALLKAAPSLIDSSADVRDWGTPLTFIGRTLNISDGGVALAIPSVPVDERFLAREDRNLSIVLDLPAGPAEIQAVPVRLAPLDEQDPGRGYVIGAHIVAATSGARRCLAEYLRQES